MTIASTQPPKGWPRISSRLVYADVNRALDWSCRAFGFEVQLEEPTTTDFGDGHWVDRSCATSDLDGYHGRFVQRSEDKS